ncbi:(S)-N-methylcoclaurine 3'-hydroxylase isozyme 1-like [Actinidia eriantha]|uniref:(S)-N-methylcoclaurine 3'-hydroxylase isozyme 1-like n=1 Tax=Actinidia eriantha TaxID=165200 RepID=UPI002590D5BC|nr:(S)-N-methylcoclaurine 3'-hydroxylase isozyme 1-like [Actinidia eriantha]
MNLFFPLILLSIILIVFLIKPISTKGPPIPPGPYPWPVVGNIFQLGKMPHVTLTALAKTHGPIMSLRHGAHLMVVGSSRAAAREILKAHDRALSGRFVKREFKIKGSKLHNISIGFAEECNDQWKNLRSIGRSELFSGKAIESQSSIRSEKITEMVRYLCSKEGSAVDMAEKVYVVVSNILSNAIFSVDYVDFDGEGVGGEMRKLIREFVVLALGATPNLTDVFPVLGDWDVMGTSKKCKGIFEKMYAIWEGIIEERRKQSSRQHDLLDTLVKLDLTNDQINPFIMELFSAGTEPTTLTVQWALAELITNEGPRHKLLDELEKEVGQDIVRETNLPHLPYLEACIKEALRLHPPAPLLLPHRATQTCQVMGYTIPKDAIVNVNLWAMARDPKIWADPLRFNPERFLVSGGPDYMGSNYEYLPFGSGRRMCPGQPLVTRMVPPIVGTLVHLFDWALPGDTGDPAHLDTKEKRSIKELPLRLVPKTRKQLKFVC